MNSKTNNANATRNTFTFGDGDPIRYTFADDLVSLAPYILATLMFCGSIAWFVVVIAALVNAIA
jgi:hypothetical protein